MVRISLVPALTPLYLYDSTFRSMWAVPNVAVFCSSLTSWFPDMLLTYFLNDFEMVAVAPIISGITFVFTFHVRCVSIVRSLCFRFFSAYFLITFLSPEIAAFINVHLLLFIYYLLHLSFHSLAVVLTLVQTKQMNIHKRNNTKTQYKQYKTQ
jgi:hypothetical protein